MATRHRVLIVGGGYGGLYAAKALAGADVDVTLVDRRNHHVFSPLLYQVATGALAPSEIAQPLRLILRRQSNVRVLLAEARDIDPGDRIVTLDDGAEPRLGDAALGVVVRDARSRQPAHHRESPPARRRREQRPHRLTGSVAGVQTAMVIAETSVMATIAARAMLPPQSVARAVGVGRDGDTAAFAVETLRRWWARVGAPTYPGARRLLVCADAGGSNGYRVRLWKLGLAKLATEIGLPITVCHFPPGTSKWNKIEHRLFSAITSNWRGRPLTSHEVVVELIGATTTRTGLTVHAEVDTNAYPRGLKVSDAEMAAIHPQIEPDPFHGDWNYTVRPRASA